MSGHLFSIYTDGSSHASGNKPGGWGWLLVGPDDKPIACDSGYDPSTTNNVMELTAALKGLEYAAKVQGTLQASAPSFELVSDSQYCLGMATGKMVPSKNLDLVTRLQKAFRDVPGTTVRWVRGHDGNKWNEMADQLAVTAKKSGGH